MVSEFWEYLKNAVSWRRHNLCSTYRNRNGVKDVCETMSTETINGGEKACDVYTHLPYKAAHGAFFRDVFLVHTAAIPI